MLRNLLLSTHISALHASCFAILAFFLYSLSDAMAKYLMAEGYDRAFILVINSIPSTIILTAFMIKRHGIRNAYHTQFKKLHILRGLALVGITFFGLKALTLLPLTDFYGIIFSTPFVTTLGAYIFFKEKVTLTEFICIAIGFSGVIIVAQPDYNQFNIGYVYAFLGVLCVSAAGLLVRRIGREENPFLFIIFGNIAIFAFNIIPSTFHVVPNVTATHIVVFTFYCITIPMAVLIMSAIFARAPSVANIVPFQYTQIIWGAIIGYVLFNDVPQMNTIIGAIVVISCGLYILLYHKRKRRRELRLPD
jgi:S-adenosylmethionine uptake transporter